jgi:hypothetical protein
MRQIKAFTLATAIICGAVVAQQPSQAFGGGFAARNPDVTRRKEANLWRTKAC